jgi:Flp pilus assembly pilin Flp
VRTLRSFWNDDQGQDLIEYTLLMAFVVLGSGVIIMGGSTKGIWSSGNCRSVAAPGS